MLLGHKKKHLPRFSLKQWLWLYPLLFQRETRVLSIKTNYFRFQFNIYENWKSTLQANNCTRQNLIISGGLSSKEHIDKEPQCPKSEPLEHNPSGFAI